MVFLGGPRQVGKTTLALGILGATDTPPDSLRDHPGYFNWDTAKAKARLLKGDIPGAEKLLVLNEIHKYSRWRNLVKGFFDEYRGRKAFLITGSARLDYYSRGGDSLQGRYHYLRLHPLSLMELSKGMMPTQSHLSDLLEYGGFPEPFFEKNKTEWRRWQLERLDRVVEDDLRDLEQVRDIVLIRLLIDALPERVGSPLSINKLSQALEVSHPTLKRYLDILDHMYVTYRISPYGSPKIRAVKKEQKLYLWDWSILEDQGARFENLVASQLLKYCDFMTDTQGYRMELRFLRDTDKREVDFVVIRDKKPLFAVECKTGQKQLSPHISYFKARTAIPYFYQVHLGQRDSGDPAGSGRLIPFVKFCHELNMP